MVQACINLVNIFGNRTSNNFVVLVQRTRCNFFYHYVYTTGRKTLEKADLIDP